MVHGRTDSYTQSIIQVLSNKTLEMSAQQYGMPAPIPSKIFLTLGSCP